MGHMKATEVRDVIATHVPEGEDKRRLLAYIAGLETVARPSWADMPLTLSEHAADRNRDSSRWTARDILIAALRDVDSGVVKPLGAVLILDLEEEGPTWWNASSDFLRMSGAVAVATLSMRAQYLGLRRKGE